MESYRGSVESLSRLIRDARAEAGLSQVELASRMGTTQSAVSRWERGHDEPRMSTVASVLAACGRVLKLSVEVDDGTGVDDGVDRAQIRQQLAMSPAERLASVVNISRTLATARPVPR